MQMKKPLSQSIICSILAIFVSSVAYADVYNYVGKETGSTPKVVE